MYCNWIQLQIGGHAGIRWIARAYCCDDHEQSHSQVFLAPFSTMPRASTERKRYRRLVQIAYATCRPYSHENKACLLRQENDEMTEP